MDWICLLDVCLLTKGVSFFCFYYGDGMGGVLMLEERT